MFLRVEELVLLLCGVPLLFYLLNEILNQAAGVS
jgi:hypothetical protein